MRLPCRPITILALSLIGTMPLAHAQFDPSKEYVENPAVAAPLSPIPPLEIRTPAFAPGRAISPSQDELMAFVDELAGRARRPARAHRRPFAGKPGDSVACFARPSAAFGGDVLEKRQADRC